MLVPIVTKNTKTKAIVLCTFIGITEKNMLLIEETSKKSPSTIAGDLKLRRKECLRLIEEHIRFDQLTKKYSCGVCKKEFTRKDTLQNHFESLHMDTEGYACPYCDKSYPNKSYRTTHIFRNHREEHAAYRGNF